MRFDTSFPIFRKKTSIVNNYSKMAAKGKDVHSGNFHAGHAHIVMDSATMCVCLLIIKKNSAFNFCHYLIKVSMDRP